VRMMASPRFTLSLLRPAVHDRFIATGSVVGSGRRLSVCTAEVKGVNGEGSISFVAMNANDHRYFRSLDGGLIETLGPPLLKVARFVL
jgi:hypothetical protein